jgi:thiol-disulfide isomerase/thioredoxin
MVYKSFFTTSGFSTITGEDQKTPELMFFFADWCPHCKTAKPEWIATKEYLDEHQINNHKVFCIDYNCSEKTPEIETVTNKYKIEGFPTIKLQYDNTIHDFNQTPTKDNILEFLNTIIK